MPVSCQNERLRGTRYAAWKPCIRLFMTLDAAHSESSGGDHQQGIRTAGPLP